MKKAKPTDFLKPSTQYAGKEQALERLSICNGCPRLHMKICGACGCFMPAKVKLGHAVCPEGKW